MKVPFESISIEIRSPFVGGSVVERSPLRVIFPLLGRVVVPSVVRWPLMARLSRGVPTLPAVGDADTWRRRSGTMGAGASTGAGNEGRVGDEPSEGGPKK